MVESQEESRGGRLPAEGMRIGVLALRTGISIDAIRYYERRGVLAPAVRTQANYRLFPVEAVERLLWTRRLQGLGLTLDEIVDALQAHDRGGVNCDSERWRLEAVRTRLYAQIRELTATRDQVDRLLDDCRGGRCAFTIT